MMCFSVSIGIRAADGGKFFGDINSHRAPGDAAATTDTAGAIKLVDPGSELVSHPLAITRFGG